MFGLIFYTGISTGGASIQQDVSGVVSSANGIRNIKVESENVDNILGFELISTDDVFLMPVCVGVMWNLNKFHIKGELSGNVMAFRSSKIKELAQFKIGFGYEFFQNFVTSFIIGGHLSHHNKVSVNVNYKNYEEEVFSGYIPGYFSTIKSPDNPNSLPIAFTPWAYFVGIEGQYKFNPYVYFVGSIQTNLKTKEYNGNKHGIFAAVDFPAKNNIIENSKLSDSAIFYSTMNWRIMMGLLIKLGGL